ncbi:hypothetical protein FRB99_003879 [Tulasnella sp. 403]|nr:hypothetical protein FRB99_003879 [Tulasnella sp. 403]
MSSSNILQGDKVPKRKGKGLRDVEPPLYRTPLTRLVYIISFSALLISAFYTYRLTQWKSTSGGWLNLIQGKRPDTPIQHAPHLSSPNKDAFVLEDRLRELADELGIHPRALASAIRPLLPAATVTSIAAANPTSKGSVASVLADDSSRDQTADKAKHGLDAILGLDEPVDFNG